MVKARLKFMKYSSTLESFTSDEFFDDVDKVLTTLFSLHLVPLSSSPYFMCLRMNSVMFASYARYVQAVEGCVRSSFPNAILLKGGEEVITTFPQTVPSEWIITHPVYFFLAKNYLDPAMNLKYDYSDKSMNEIIGRYIEAPYFKDSTFIKRVIEVLMKLKPDIHPESNFLLVFRVVHPFAKGK